MISLIWTLWRTCWVRNSSYVRGADESPRAQIARGIADQALRHESRALQDPPPNSTGPRRIDKVHFVLGEIAQKFLQEIRNEGNVLVGSCF
ncbi:uncharacterized protein J3R85_016249 [Psidium guajava]|nr:uncharacterized protein J3R85_016249 [Psidium guajava]